MRRSVIFCFPLSFSFQISFSPQIARFLLIAILLVSSELVLGTTFFPHFLPKAMGDVLETQETSPAQKIKQIRIRGAERVSVEYVRSVIVSSEGERLNPLLVRKDIERIYKLGFFSDVKAEFKDGVLTFYVREKPVISEIKVEGRKKLDEEKLKEAIFLKEGDFFDEGKLKSQISQILETYMKEGFIFARVTPEVEKLPENRVKVKLKIREGQEFFVRKIVFSGAKHVSSQVHMNYLSTKERGILSAISGEGKLDLILIEGDKTNLMNSYLDMGYLDSSASDPAIMFNPRKGEAVVIYRVHEGIRYKVKDVSIQGDIIFPWFELKNNLKTKEGDFFSRKVVLEDIEWLTTLYQDVGFAEARAVPLLSKNIPANGRYGEVSLSFSLKRGKMFYVRYINIRGNTRTRDNVIRREFSILEGEVFSRSLLFKSYINLMRTGFFESVEINPVFYPDGQADIEVDVKEGRVGAVSLGGGFAPQVGGFFESLFFILQGNVNNFRGLGQKLGFYLTLGGGIVFFNFYFQDNHAFDTDYILGVNAYRYQSLFLPFLRISTGGNGTFGLFLTERTKLTMSPGFEIIDVFDRNTQSRIPFYTDDKGAGFQKSDSRFLRIKVENDTRDNPIVPSRGRLIFGWSEVGGAFGGDLYYVKGGFSSTFFIPLPLGLVFSPALRIGIGAGLTSSRFLPYPERFFAGGIYSIRGFDYFTLGPRKQYEAPTGDISTVFLGGNKSFISNLELIIPVFRQAGFFLVLFSDIGQVFSEEEIIDPREFRVSAGVELRWISPFGPLRFSFGIPIVRKPGDITRFFDFSLGLFTFYPELEEF